MKRGIKNRGHYKISTKKGIDSIDLGLAVKGVISRKYFVRYVALKKIFKHTYLTKDWILPQFCGKKIKI